MYIYISINMFICVVWQGYSINNLFVMLWFPVYTKHQTWCQYNQYIYVRKHTIWNYLHSRKKTQFQKKNYRNLSIKLWHFENREKLIYSGRILTLIFHPDLLFLVFNKHFWIILYIYENCLFTCPWCWQNAENFTRLHLYRTYNQ